MAEVLTSPLSFSRSEYVYLQHNDPRSFSRMEQRLPARVGNHNEARHSRCADGELRMVGLRSNRPVVR